MKTSEIDYKAAMKVDPNALDVEWLGQAELARKYANHWVRLQREARRAEENVKVVRSELARFCNDNPVKCTGKEKPTALDIEAYYRTHPKHKAAKDAWIEAAYEAEYAELAYKEISFTRKASLENLVSLYASQYFAGPSAPRNLSKEWEKIQKRRISDDAVVIKPRRTT